MKKVTILVIGFAFCWPKWEDVATIYMLTVSMQLCTYKQEFTL